jgi:hypothetical protein
MKNRENKTVLWSKPETFNPVYLVFPFWKNEILRVSAPLRKQMPLPINTKSRDKRSRLP